MYVKDGVMKPIKPNVAIYCRLSNEDGRNTESRSIETQREICMRYAAEHGWTVSQIYVDDGYSGTHFERPDYQRMKMKIERGEIDCVIVKDLSRLGRNAAKMTLELEHFNDNYGLRFISITEDIDAANTNDYNEIFQIVLVLNEMVPRDCSRKIKSSWINGVTNGKFMFGTPPFGYERGRNNNLCLEVDPVAARHVQRIFSLYAGGESMRGIAEIFNREQYPSPRAYYYDKMGRSNPVRESDTWNSNTIRNILENEAYVGVLVQGKRRTISYKNKNRKLVPQEEWHRTESAHDAIIEKELWDFVQQRRKTGSRVRALADGEPSIFAGMLTCGECGSPLSRAKSRGRAVYRCSTYNNKGKEACSSHRVSEEVLLNIFRDSIGGYIAKSSIDPQKMEIQVWNQFQEKTKETSRLISARQKRLSVQIDSNQSAMRKLLDEGAKGYLPSTVLQEQLSNLHTELSELWNELNVANEQAKIHKKRRERDSAACLALIEKQLSLEKLDRSFLMQLIEKVVVSERINEKGRNIKLKIKYRFSMDSNH